MAPAVAFARRSGLHHRRLRRRSVGHCQLIEELASGRLSRVVVPATGALMGLSAIATVFGLFYNR
jgi:hypothetical protein